MPAFPTQGIDQLYMLVYGGYGYLGCGEWGGMGPWGCGCSAFLGLASGLPPAGSNPPYTISDFLAIYPKFFGPAVASYGLLTQGDATVPLLGTDESYQPGQLVAGNGIPAATVITDVLSQATGTNGDTQVGSQIILNTGSTTGIEVGNTITGPGIQVGTLISGVGSNQLAISLPATATATQVQLQINGVSLVLSNAPTISTYSALSIYTAPLVSLAIMQIYLNIAYAALMQTRWREQWYLVMALYIAHYLTLWLETEANPQTTGTQIVANSLQAGITISQSADGVAQGLQALEALNNWAAWSLTQYGVQLSTLARVVGAGPIYVRSGPRGSGY